MLRGELLQPVSAAGFPSIKAYVYSRSIKIPCRCGTRRLIAITEASRGFLSCEPDGLKDSKMAVVWVVAPCRLVWVYRRFRGQSCSTEVVSTSETLLNSYQCTRRYYPEHSHLHSHRHQNLKSYLKDSSFLRQGRWVRYVLPKRRNGLQDYTVKPCRPRSALEFSLHLPVLWSTWVSYQHHLCVFFLPPNPTSLLFLEITILTALAGSTKYESFIM
jgi:hypothetical protein